jgi:hypothetical protein
MMLAIQFKAQELVLTEDESKMLAGAFLGVAKYHEQVFDPKKMAYGQLAFALIAVYGTRIIAIKSRKKNEAQQAHTANVETSLPNNVAQFYAHAPAP